MSAKKHKRKTVKQSKNHQITKTPAKQSGLVSKYPRASMSFGALLILAGAILLLVGMQNDTRFGLAMLSIAVGVVVMFFANIAMPKKAVKATK